jgi:hypothetical protein
MRRWCKPQAKSRVIAEEPVTRWMQRGTDRDAGFGRRFAVDEPGEEVGVRKRSAVGRTTVRLKIHRRFNA